MNIIIRKKSTNNDKLTNPDNLFASNTKSLLVDQRQSGFSEQFNVCFFYFLKFISIDDSRHFSGNFFKA